jgi:hypothetical protein
MADDTPLNIWSRADEEIGRLMSHFAHTPFVLDGVEFGSVEAFYSWLACGDDAHRREKVRPMWGARAKRQCPKIKPEYFDYHGRTVRFGSAEHRELIMQANRAKLDAYPEIARRFVATLPRPIRHDIDGSDDPGVEFRSIMTELRAEYAAKLGHSA